MFAADIQAHTHVQELLQVEAVQQYVHTHVPQGAGLQNVAQEFHVTEGVHHYHQGLYEWVVTNFESFIPLLFISRTIARAQKTGSFVGLKGTVISEKT